MMQSFAYLHYSQRSLLFAAVSIKRHLVEKYLEEVMRANIGGLGRLLTQELPDASTYLVLTSVAGRQVQQLYKVHSYNTIYGALPSKKKNQSLLWRRVDGSRSHSGYFL